jgi:23S rRNA (guanosine2251-2'-O)-methyltransferase
MKKEVYLLLHDIRSTHNVGSIFRTADAAGISKIYISGYTPRPINQFGKPIKEIAKTALGAEQTIPWEDCGKTPTSLIKKLKNKGVQVIALEQDANSVDYKKIKVKYPMLFVLGNEVEGVSKSLLKHTDVICEIPMRGKKESLNVGVSFGVAIFRLLGI